MTERIIDDPLILTARFDPQAQFTFQSLRDRHFPAHVNVVPAHLTLFHHLPGSSWLDIDAILNGIAGQQAIMPFQTIGPRFLGRGVALELGVAALSSLRAQLATVWKDWLTPQDRQRFQPHVTIQNKVASTEARRLYDEFSAACPSVFGNVIGLDLWFYRGGPWERTSHYAFRVRPASVADGDRLAGSAGEPTIE